MESKEFKMTSHEGVRWLGRNQSFSVRLRFLSIRRGRVDETAASGRDHLVEVHAEAERDDRGL